MKMLYAIVSILFLGLVILAVLVFTQKRRSGFVHNAKLFEKFEGTILLQKKLENQKLTNKSVLDSLNALILTGRKDLEGVYTYRLNSFADAEARTSEQYTAELWRFINDGIKEYGDKYEYDFIYGAAGSGNLMYANEQLDLTDDVLDFVNKKYRTGK